MGVVISDIPLIRKEILMYQQICNNDGYLRARLMEIAAQLSDLCRETGINNVSIKIQGNKSLRLMMLWCLKLLPKQIPNWYFKKFF